MHQVPEYFIEQQLTLAEGQVLEAQRAFEKEEFRSGFELLKRASHVLRAIRKANFSLSPRTMERIAVLEATIKCEP